eukprot:GHRQ01019672.1.p1 GENE.GHRQ01019672.1~~GHRQ01019672.1.p1  ORF type:complete len:231 (+),score=80.59 GHRQ01019672.1:164-856(+)
MQSKLSSSGAATGRSSNAQLRSPSAPKSSQLCASSTRDAATSSVAVDRRQLLAGTAAVLIATSAEVPAAAVAATKAASGDWSSPGLAAPEDENLPKFFKTASGVKVQELAPGSGEVAKAGDSVLIDYVLRRNNGYFIYSTIEGISFQPRDVPVGPIRLQLGSGNIIDGLQDALVGMRQGGKRRVLVPPELGYVSSVLQPQPPTFATKRQLANHSSESLLFEIELLRVLPA